jgi:hypothetical protein
VQAKRGVITKANREQAAVCLAKNIINTIIKISKIGISPKMFKSI